MQCIIVWWKTLKAFMNFVVLEPSTKVSSVKFGSAVPTYDRLKHSAKVFSMKMVTSYRSFLPRKFPAIW